MGDTERAALEAGTVGFEGRIFAGQPDFDALNKLVRRTLSFEEAAQGMQNPELALAYLRAADRVIQVDDFPS